MKCPRCHSQDVVINTSPQLHLLSFTFTTVQCAKCAGVFAVPAARQATGNNEPVTIHPELQRRHAA
jgi:hypothetical protein